MSKIRITGPTELPITLAFAKQHARVSIDAEDDLITQYIHAAVEAAEHYMGRSLMPQTWEVRLDAFPLIGQGIPLDMPPVQSVTEIGYLPADGDGTTEDILSTDDYFLDPAALPAWVMPASGVLWPDVIDRANAVRVRYETGYASAAVVPANIRIWLAVAVCDLYEKRSFTIDAVSVVDNRFTRSMLGPHRARF